jgi:hypothetical protein
MEEICSEKINERFNEELQRQIDGKLPKGHVYRLGKPENALLAAGVADLPIEVSAKRIATKADSNYRRKHPFDLQDIKDLPKAINNPIAVFNSTKNDGAKIILTELKDKNGNNFVVVIRTRINPDIRKVDVGINSLQSLYPKDNITDLINWFKSGYKLIAWLNKEKALRFISTQSTNLIAGGEKTQDPVINILNNFQNGKVLVKKT